jgi:putative FmdB family regulatory protein
MPIYEYNCDPCNYRFEMIKPLTHHDKNEICPSCRGKAEKVFSLFAYIGPNSGDNGFSSASKKTSVDGCQSGQCACAANPA